jgi:catechol 2,3-dioxygenase-like lactoylglutathione lyase family enzyme
MYAWPDVGGRAESRVRLKRTDGTISGARAATFLLGCAPAHPRGSSRPEMPLQLVAVAFDTEDPQRVGAFWASLLGRDFVRETGGVLLPGDDTQIGLRFVEAATETPGPNRVHLHLTSSTREDQQDTVARARNLGARDIDVGQLPEEGHVVLADPGDNEFCVIEPGNAYLAGCGFLGEITCEGTRDVGLFWREALGWPLVWDRDQQTAVQSPEGGTKLSWDVRPGPPNYGSRRQRLDLASSDLAVDVARLMALGANDLGDRDGRIVLSDPDGGEFSLGRA